MASKTNAWEPLLQILERLFPNIAPQIVPGAHNAKEVLQAIQASLKNCPETRIATEVHCKWCGRAVSSDRVKVTGERILTWVLDWSKKVLKVKGVQFCCEECNLLLDLKRLLNFLLMLDNSIDNTKLYSLASHFCQVNGHTSQSGEDDVKLLQQAVSVIHSLHLLTKSLVDLTAQGPSGENITLESVDKLVKSLLTEDACSVTSSTPNVKRKKIKETSSTEGENITLVRSHSTSVKKVKSSAKKKKKKIAHDSLTNGHIDGDTKEGDRQEDVTRKQLVLSEKKKKAPEGKVEKHRKKRRSLPVMKLD